MRSCLGLPLTGATGLVAGYNLYSVWPDAFAADTRGQLEVFAGNSAGAVAVAVAMKLADQAQLSDDPCEALTSRAVIDQATGIIMAQQRCGAQQTGRFSAGPVQWCAGDEMGITVADATNEAGRIKRSSLPLDPFTPR